MFLQDSNRRPIDDTKPPNTTTSSRYTNYTTSSNAIDNYINEYIWTSFADIALKPILF